MWSLKKMSYFLCSTLSSLLLWQEARLCQRRVQNHPKLKSQRDMPKKLKTQKTKSQLKQNSKFKTKRKAQFLREIESMNLPDGGKSYSILGFLMLLPLQSTESWLQVILVEFAKQTQSRIKLLLSPTYMISSQPAKRISWKHLPGHSDGSSLLSMELRHSSAALD